VTGLLPLDVACPPPPVGCGTPAGRRCFWRTPIGKVRGPRRLYTAGGGAAAGLLLTDLLALAEQLPRWSR
jgi:hypothetical protein